MIDSSEVTNLCLFWHWLSQLEPVFDRPPEDRGRQIMVNEFVYRVQYLKPLGLRLAVPMEPIPADKLGIIVAMRSYLLEHLPQLAQQVGEVPAGWEGQLPGTPIRDIARLTEYLTANLVDLEETKGLWDCERVVIARTLLHNCRLVARKLNLSVVKDWPKVDPDDPIRAIDAALELLRAEPPAPREAPAPDDSNALQELQQLAENRKGKRAKAMPKYPKPEGVTTGDHMWAILHKNVDAKDWTIRQWEKMTGMSRGAIGKTNAWKSIRNNKPADGVRAEVILNDDLTIRNRKR